MRPLRLLVLALAGVALARPSSAADAPVIVDGSSTVFRISRVAQESFVKSHPGTNVVVNSQGTGGGFRNYLAGKTDIVDASRPANKDESAKMAADPKLAASRFTVGYDGITVAVNPKNDFVKALSVPQLKKLFEPDSKVTTWADLDPSWPARRIKLYTPDTASGTFDYFTEEIVGKAKAQRKDVNASPDDNVLVNGVSKDADGLGYFGYAYYKVNAKKIRAVPVARAEGVTPVAPSHETILAGTYSPLSRPLFLYVKHSSLKRETPAAFLKHYLGNVAAFSEKAGYVAPTAADLEANAKALASAMGGTQAAVR